MDESVPDTMSRMHEVITAAAPELKPRIAVAAAPFAVGSAAPQEQGNPDAC